MLIDLSGYQTPFVTTFAPVSAKICRQEGARVSLRSLHDSAALLRQGGLKIASLT